MADSMSHIHNPHTVHMHPYHSPMADENTRKKIDMSLSMILAILTTDTPNYLYP